MKSGQRCYGWTENAGADIEGVGKTGMDTAGVDTDGVYIGLHS